MRRRRFSRAKRKSAWLALANFQVNAPAAADNQVILFSLPASPGGTRIGLGATLLSSSGIQLAVGGESGKTRRIVGDVAVSSVITGGTTVADIWVREAIMWCKVDPAGNINAALLDLFDNEIMGSEDILWMRHTYRGAVDTVGAVVRPNIYDQWFQEGGYMRIDTTVTRRLDDSSLLVYVVCVKRQTLVADPALAFVISGELRAIIAR